jgi:replicative DNA helicase
MSHALADPFLEEIFLSRVLADHKLLDTKIHHNIFSVPKFQEIYGALIELRWRKEPLTEDGIRVLRPEFSDDIRRLCLRPLGQVSTEAVRENLEAMRVRRALVEIGAACAKRAEEDEDPHVTAAEIERSLLEVRLKDDRMKSVKVSSMKGVLDRLEVMNKTEDGVIGVRSGFRQIDESTRGFQGKKIYILGARPGAGKTALLGNMEVFWERNNVRHHICNVEVAPDDLRERKLSMVTGVSANPGRPFFAPELRKLGAGVAEMSKWKSGRMLTAGRITARQWYDEVMVMHREEPVKVAILDYIQRIKPDGANKRKNERRDQEIGEVMEVAMDLASQDIAVIVVSALNRGQNSYNRALDQHKQVQPGMDDLKESGDLEQDADHILLLWKETSDATTVHGIVPKNRSGQPGVRMKFDFDGSLYKFTE